MKTKGSSEHEREDYFELIPKKKPNLDMPCKLLCIPTCWNKDTHI